MKKWLRRIGIVLGVMFVVGIFGNLSGNFKEQEAKEEPKVEKVTEVAKEEDVAEQKAKEEEEAKKKAEAEEVAAAKKAEEEEAARQAEEEKINIGLTVDEFEAAWAKNIAEVGAKEMTLKNSTAEEGPMFNTKTYGITKNASVLLSINKGNKMIKNITVIAMPSDNEADNADILLTYALTIGSADPSLVPEERGEIFFALTDQNPALEEMDSITTYNGLRYTLAVSRSVGMWLIIEDEDQQY
jgi:hypothetical protein